MSDRPSGSAAPIGSRGLLDTSVVIDFDSVDTALLPDETAISAITLAELAAGPHAARDDAERGRRQDRLLWAGSQWDPLPFGLSSGAVPARRCSIRRSRKVSGAGRGPGRS